MRHLDPALSRPCPTAAPLVRRHGHVDGWLPLYLQDGWNYGGFKASPASGWYFADLIANNRPDPVIANHTLDRFSRGINIDERGAGPDPKLHG